MKMPIGLIAIFCAAMVLAPGAPGSAASSGNSRQAVWAGQFYPEQPLALTQMIEALTMQARQTALELPTGRPLRAIVLPHAGYVYSGLTAAHAARVLSAHQFKRVLLLGPDHRVGFRGGAISTVAAYQTPLGEVFLDTEVASLRDQKALFQASSASDLSEHSLEVVLPFLQYYLKDFSLIPIVLGSADIQQTAEALAPLLNDDTLLVVSSDLSHFLGYDQAVAKDRATIDMILDLDSSQLARHENSACGKGPLLVLMQLARTNGWQPQLLHYSNSGDTAGDRRRVVGYSTIAFWGGKPPATSQLSPPPLSPEQGHTLVRLARQALEEAFNQRNADGIADADLAAPCFQSRCGTFVTLKKHGQLRGCIGNIMADGPLAESVRRNALNAAFRDPRFRPLKAGELNEIHISVSVLSPPRPLIYDDGRDLRDQLRIDTDGVIVRKGLASATFLPQVWQQLPDPDRFLSALCRKAGLAAGAWQIDRLEVFTYQAQYFDEAD